VGKDQFEKGGQGEFEAFLNPPKSPFAKGELATTSFRLTPMSLGGQAMSGLSSKNNREAGPA